MKKYQQTTYLAPCFPPLFGFINMSNGCVPGNGVIWNDPCKEQNKCKQFNNLSTTIDLQQAMYVWNDPWKEQNKYKELIICQQLSIYSKLCMLINPPVTLTPAVSKSKLYFNLLTQIIIHWYWLIDLLW